MKSSLVPLSSVLEELFKKKTNLGNIYLLLQIKRKWKNLMGGEISKSAVPVKLKNQQLFLSVPDSSHIQEMQFIKEDIKEKLNESFPEMKIKKINLKIQNN